MIQFESFLFVEIKEKHKDSNIVMETGNPFALWIGPEKGMQGERISLPKEAAEWDIVATSSEIDEYIAKYVVESVDYDVPPSPGNDFQGDWRVGWRDYENDYETGCSEYPFVHTPMASYNSLLKAAVVTYNRFVILKKITQ